MTELNYTKENTIYGTTCPSCGVFTPDNLAVDPELAHKRRAAPALYEALKRLCEVYMIEKEIQARDLFPDYWRNALVAVSQAEGKG